MCLFGKKVIIKQDELNDQKGQNPKNDKRAGGNKSEHRGQNVEN